MIDEQSYDDDVKFVVRKNEVLCDVRCMGEHFSMTGVAAVKLGHAMIQAGEKALEKAGMVKK